MERGVAGRMVAGSGDKVTCQELAAGFRKLELESTCPVIAHASLSAFGQVEGGAETVIQAMLEVFEALLMPTFTYKTMLTPENGPSDNGLVYGSRRDQNRMAEFYHRDMPVDRLIGAVPEALRRHPHARRSKHPILSFAGVNITPALEAQTLSEPLRPIRLLTEMGGWVLLLGVDHTVNTSIHYAERSAGRKQFVRWALTPAGVVECPGFPGCSDGFQNLAPRLEHIVRYGQAGLAQVQALPLREMVAIARDWIAVDPLALLCNHGYCDRCLALRAEVDGSSVIL